MKYFWVFLFFLCISPLQAAIKLSNATSEQATLFKGDASISGVLTWSGGAPAANESFDLVAYGFDVEDLKIGTVKTDAEGRYEVKNLKGKPARYRLFLSSDPLQRTFYIFVGNDAAQVLYNYSFQPRLGDPAPPHVMPDLEGKPVDLASFKGRIVILKFWAVWCGPCHAQIDELAEQLKNPAWKDKVVVLAVNGDPRRDTAVKFIREHKLDGMIHLHEPGKRIEGMRNRGFHLDSLPFTFIVDPAGIVRYRSDQTEGIAKVVEQLLKG